MKFKLDENLGERGQSLLEKAGHDVETVFSQRLCSTADADLIEICKFEQRCLVTLDLDFSNTLRYAPGKYAGIAVLRFAGHVTENGILERLGALVAGLEREDIHGRLWIVEEKRIRVYAGELDDLWT